MNTPSVRLFHISHIPILNALIPHMPADDIIDGVFVKLSDDEYITSEYLRWGKLPLSSKCVSFAANLEVDLKHTSMRINYTIYEPIYERLKETPRPIYSEVTPGMKQSGDIWIDYDETGEYRFYKPVPVRSVGRLHWGTKGIDIYIFWERKVFVSTWDRILEVTPRSLFTAEKRRTIVGKAPWQ